MLKIPVAFTVLVLATAVQAKPKFTGIDFSGIYECKGNDAHDGQYTGAITLKLVPAQSFSEYGAYALTSEVPDLGTYTGYAAVQGLHMSFYFGLSKPASKDYGTSIATFAKSKNGKWAFRLFYFEPEYNGGNYGLEECVHR